ncbi:hypothetical protein TNCV_2616071 [Trichonephila clavipes]|nr:hypothetical protein TNCV_2616071 [Trichonephila clavipes]
MMHDRTPVHFLCSPDFGSDVGFYSMATTITISDTCLFFFYGDICSSVSRRIDITSMDLVTRLRAACTSVDIALLQRVHSSIPLWARWTL